MPGAQLMLIPFSDSLLFLYNQHIIYSEVKLWEDPDLFQQWIPPSFSLALGSCYIRPSMFTYVFTLNTSLQHAKALILVDSHKEVILSYVIF